MIAIFNEQELQPGSDYHHAVLRGLQPGLAYPVDHTVDYGWYVSVFLKDFKGGFNSELFSIFDVQGMTEIREG